MAHRHRAGFRIVVAGLVLLLTTSACTRLADTHGYIPEQSALDQVVVGRDTKETVSLILGTPSTLGLVDDRGWYYVRSEYERFLWRAPVEIDREVVTISFTESGVVENVERFGLENGQVVAFSRRVTSNNTRGVGFLRQLFSNLGNFNPAGILN